MSKSKFSTVLAIATSAVLILAFQNCGKTKDTVISPTSSSSTGDPSHPILTTSAALAVFQNASQVSDAVNLAVNTSYDVRLQLDNLTASSVVWKANTGVAGFANCSLIGTDNLTRSLSCSSVGTAHVEAAVTFSDGTSANKVFERMVASSGTVVPPSNIVAFNITAGTANQPWNTMAAPVVVFVGQTLHIVNNDSGVHRLHTPGSPCPHEPANISTGQSYDCVIAAAKPVATNTLYDHNVGPSASFYVNAIDGAAIYSTQKFAIGGVQKGCVDCHGALASSAKKNATLAQIKAGIAANSGGMGAIVLTDDQLKAVVYELSK